MSTLEESLKLLAESNVTLAKAQTYYADTINKFGLKIEKANEGKTPNPDGEATGSSAPPPKAETAAQKKKREAAESAAREEETGEEETGEDDGFGEEEEEKGAPENISAEDVRAILLKVRDKFGDKSHAIDICKKFGYKGIPDIKEKDYEKVFKAAKAKLAA